ncbi:MAG TPA: peptidyl-tRNA hydrolase [Candidatus Hodarchaeales archaeon]|nr:peptidyl-tRNA hydrolase [Candidatus Hodarchaeales archaeon]
MKQVIAVRSDIFCTKGQTTRLIAWASLSSALKTSELATDKLKAWLLSGQKKIVIKIKNVDDLKVLHDLISHAKNLIFTEIRGSEDFGTSEYEKEIVAIGIGPEREKVLDQFTSEYSLY